MNPRRAPRRRGAHAFGTLLAVLVSIPIWGSDEEVSLRIIGATSPSEGKAVHYRAILEGRIPLARGPEGYRPPALSSPPSGAFLPMIWEPPIEYEWHFGDGTAPVSTGSTPSVTHRFSDDSADQEISIRVVAKTKGLDWKVFATKKIVVKNRAPGPGRAGAIRVDPATPTFEFTAAAMDAAGDRDELAYEWDFGDGGEGTGEKVSHRYRLPGTYKAKVTISDGDGGESEYDVQIVVDANGSEPVPVEEESPPADVGFASGFEGSVDGIVSSPIEAEIRPFANLFLSHIGNGVCRLAWTGWDPKRLGVITFIADMPYLPAEGAQWSNFRPRVLQLAFQPDAEDWSSSYSAANSSIAGLGSVGANAVLSHLGDSDGKGGGSLGEQEERTDENTVNEVLTDLGAGFRVGARENQRFAAPPVATSPFGLNDNLGFEANGANISFSIVPHEYAKAEFENVEFIGEDKDGNQLSVTLSGTSLLDLEAAQRDGIVDYDSCAPRPTLTVDDVHPTDGSREEDGHVRSVEVSFDRDYDPESLDRSSFQITYRSPDGQAVEVPSRLVRRARSARLYPLEPLFSGVRYTARVKTGDEGVRGLTGSKLEDINDESWYTWDFWTQVDPETKPGGATRLGCHVHQSVRDAPLIMEKPAVARVYLEWEPDRRVHLDDQVDAVSARVPWKVGSETIEVAHTYLRNDLETKQRKRLAENTANVFWVPEQGQSEYLPAILEVEGVKKSTYRTICHAPLWDRKPVLKIDYYVLAINTWEDEAALDEAIRLVEQLMPKSRELTRQLFPFHRVIARYRGIIHPPESNRARFDLDYIHIGRERPKAERQLEELSTWGDGQIACLDLNVGVSGKNVKLQCPQRLLVQGYLADGGTDADIIVGFRPGNGGGAHQRIGGANRFPGVDGRGVITFGSNLELARLTHVVPHEIGHSLALEHLPVLTNAVGDGACGLDSAAACEQQSLKAVLEHAWNQNRAPVHEFQGIEGFRIDSSGISGHNKSSTEGNGESDWLVPAMHPIGIHAADIWMTRHHYLDVMEFIEASPVLE